MASAGMEIVNPRTGQRTLFVKTARDTNGALLLMESFHPPHGAPEPEHVHPFQESRCQIVSGTLRFCVAGEMRTLGPGDVLTIPVNVPHYFLNDSGQEAHALQEFRPALDIEDFFVKYFALARDGKLNAQGLPNLLQLAVLMQAYDDDIRATSPPRIAQRLVMWTLGPVGRMLGYSST